MRFQQSCQEVGNACTVFGTIILLLFVVYERTARQRINDVVVSYYVTRWFHVGRQKIMARAAAWWSSCERKTARAKLEQFWPRQQLWTKNDSVELPYTKASQSTSETITERQASHNNQAK